MKQRGKTIYGNDRSDHRFPGIRKDYFLKKYAEYLMDQGLHIGILENDFGAINVDMLMLHELRGDQCELEMIAGGCDAESHRRRFRTKLISMRMCGYDRVLVEPSGIYDVDEFLMYFGRSHWTSGMRSAMSSPYWMQDWRIISHSRRTICWHRRLPMPEK